MRSDLPVLYSFRRCPYAMRARLAVAASGVPVELREIVLRDKAAAFLAVSESATVPCLELPDQVIDESFDIMVWALAQNDPDGWLQMPDTGHTLVAEADGPFKTALDRTKYHSRHPDRDPGESRADGMAFLNKLEDQLGEGWLFGGKPSLADMAILPFVRQFAFVDKARFDADAGPNVTRWLDVFLNSTAFAAIMPKLPKWHDGDTQTLFETEIILPAESEQTTPTT
ncbi:MAG: glutathione S-transferase [Shimia sp.]|uniref:glutathione S-transferase n=1 Tax=Shimia sp. TaxID=1954381 RepID=UPI004059EEBB